jgi:hypothetical protein
MKATSPTRLVMKAFFAAVAYSRFVEPEADQQVGAQPHELPAEEQHEEVLPEDEDQHGGEEQVQVGEEAWVVRVAAHVAHGVHVHEEADAGHHQQHHHGELIDEQVEGDGEPADIDPGRHGTHVGRHVGDHGGGDGEAEPERGRRGTEGEVCGAVAERPGRGQHGHEAQQRQHGDEPGESDHPRGRRDDLVGDPGRLRSEQDHVTTSAAGGRPRRASRAGSRG